MRAARYGGAHETEGVRVSRRRAVVCGDEKPPRRIEHARQVVERNGPLPVVVAGPGDGKAAVGPRPHGHRARRRVPDVPVPVGVDEVLGRRVHERDAGEEVVPARRPVDRVEGLGGAVVRVEPGPAQRDLGPQRQRACQHGSHDGAVDGLADGRGDLGASPHADALDAAGERLPLAAVEIAAGMRRIGPLDEEVLHVRLEGRRTPGDARVAAQDDERDSRQRGSGGGQPRRLDGGEIPHRRGAKLQVRVVGEDRMAGGAARARDDEGVAADAVAALEAERLEKRERRGQGLPGAVSRPP